MTAFLDFIQKLLINLLISYSYYHQNLVSISVLTTTSVTNREKYLKSTKMTVKQHLCSTLILTNVSEGSSENIYIFKIVQILLFYLKILSTPTFLMLVVFIFTCNFYKKNKKM